MTDFSYWIGVDHREPEATIVAEQSAKAMASAPFPIHHLEHLALRQANWFDRPWRIGEDGFFYDERDGKPFSTQFAHTRFLTPLLAKDAGYEGWALFTDADVLWLADPLEILTGLDPSKTVYAVPHNYNTNTKIKMDGQQQTNYNRKLWSAVMLWNLQSSRLPTVEMVNQADGGYLHRFGWLDDSDIGYLSEAWQWIPNESPTTPLALQDEAENIPTPINLVHMTLGIPTMPDRRATGFDTMWSDVLKDFYRRAY